MATPVEAALRRAVADLNAVKARWALVGGLGSDVVVDLLFASSGIEAEVVAGATRLEVLPQLTAPVASTGHLIALKVLAGRNQDLTDLEALIPGASAADLNVARNAVKLIQARGFNREQDVVTDLEKLIADMRRLAALAMTARPNRDPVAQSKFRKYPGLCGRLARQSRRQRHDGGGGSHPADSGSGDTPRRQRPRQRHRHRGQRHAPRRDQRSTQPRRTHDPQKPRPIDSAGWLRNRRWSAIQSVPSGCLSCSTVR